MATKSQAPRLPQTPKPKISTEIHIHEEGAPTRILRLPYRVEVSFKPLRDRAA